MHFVPVKSAGQQAALTPHRARAMLVKQRTMLINTLRSQLAEFGIVAPKGRGGLSDLLARLHDPEEDRLPALARQVLPDLAALITAQENPLRRIENATPPPVRHHPLPRPPNTIP